VQLDPGLTPGTGWPGMAVLVTALEAKSLKHDEPISSFACNFNLRRYNEGMTERSHRFLEWIMARPEQHIAVGRCRLTPV